MLNIVERKVRAYVASYNSFNKHNTREEFYKGFLAKYPSLKQEILKSKAAYDKIIDKMINKWREK